MTFRWSRLLLFLLFLAIIAFVVSFLLLSPLSSIIRRFPGDPNNRPVRRLAGECGANDPDQWGYNECSVMISCIFDNLREIHKNDNSIGTTILGLLPSIIGIAAAQPADIVKLSLVSPMRGIATAAFSIGISPRVFLRLRPVGTFSDSNTEQTWTIPLALFPGSRFWIHVAGKVLVDAGILAFTCCMLWQNWVINSGALVQWLCESPIMVFTWPVANMLWVLVAVLLLFSMAESVTFKHATDDINYVWWQVFLMPYTLDLDDEYEWRMEDLAPRRLRFFGWLKRPAYRRKPAANGFGSSYVAKPACSGSSAAAQRFKQCEIRIVVKMPDASILCNWQVYFFLVELFSIAIYFYATFVLLSVVFIGAVGSVRFAALMAGLYAAVSILVSVA